jgi:hypothetical protein
MVWRERLFPKSSGPVTSEEFFAFVDKYSLAL